MRLIGVDVDLVVCPSDQGWLDWFCEEARKVNKLGYSIYGNNRNYALGDYFPFIEDPMEYWRELDYFQFGPIEGSVETLEKLSKHFGIVFVSRTKGNHSKSKYYWLQKHFPFMTEYVSMHKKGVIEKAFECMIDDRLSVLQGFPQEKRVLFSTPYTQDVECSVQYSFSEWDDKVVKDICDLYLK